MDEFGCCIRAMTNMVSVLNTKLLSINKKRIIGRDLQSSLASQQPLVHYKKKVEASIILRIDRTWPAKSQGRKFHANLVLTQHLSKITKWS
jgi:hypothetical protein